MINSLKPSTAAALAFLTLQLVDNMGYHPNNQSRLFLRILRSTRRWRDTDAAWAPSCLVAHARVKMPPSQGLMTCS
ncbi:hypothetical protein GY45DRAFT_1320014 [Cubamyces sp. BRFM 1775]|nr:hypothetical protein GY45DRAFT_1320014 [Cubamyces sp. BRFM 1775]